MEKIGNLIIEELETIATSFNTIAKMMMSKKCNVKCKNLSKSKRDEMSLSKSKNIGKKGAEKVNMQKGSITYRPKENRWMYRYRDKMQNGKVICDYAKTKKEAQMLLKRELDDYYDRLRVWEKSGKPINTTAKHNQSNVINKGMTLNTWFNYWVETFKKQEVRESTYIQYIEIYNRYAAKSIGNKKVIDISASDIQSFINDIPAYSALKKTRQIFKDLFDLLHKQGYIKSNPMTLVVLPKRNKDDSPDGEDDNSKSDILLYNDELALLKYLSVGSKKKKNKYYYPVKFILYTGLRKGEMLGLRWKHIDFKNDTIKVIQQWNYNSKKISNVKSKAANRTIPLLKKAKEALLELSNLKIHTAEDFIFLNDCIGITQRLAHYTKVLDFQINAHLLRHTFASRCYAAGLDPIAIRDLLGHETVDTTLNVYTHTLTSEDKEIISQMRAELIEKGILILTHNNNAFDTYSDTQNMIL